MNLTIHEGVEGARNAQGTVVIIDVLRAATVASYLLHKGVTAIHPVETQQEAFDLKKQNPELLLVGENRGIKIDGFDLGNSPSVIKTSTNLSGKKIVHRSSTGTQGVVNAVNAKKVIFGSFVSAQAIINFLLLHESEHVTLVPMYALEDQLFAEYLSDRLSGKKTLSISEIKDQLKNHEWILNSFLNPHNTNFPEEDFELSLELDVFDFFPIVRDGQIVKSSL